MPRPPKALRRTRRDPRLSLVMIVKNEAATLERCLASARPHVDEIVVVDTGSTDGTPEIARHYADVYDEIEWPDSFSIARNYSFDQATGDFLLILDGDEYIGDEAGWRQLRKVLRTPNLAAVMVPVCNLLPEGQMMAGDRLWQERVVRNHPIIRYSGAVHNQIQDSIADYIRRTGAVYKKVEVEVVHTGYALDPDQMKRKYAPRVKLLVEEAEHGPTHLHRTYYAYQLGVAYFVMQRNEDASAIWRTLDYATLTPQNAFYAHLLASQTAIKLDEPTRALGHANAMFELDAGEPMAYFSAGLAFMAQKEFVNGTMMLLEAYDRNAAAGTDVRFVLNADRLLGLFAEITRRAGMHDYAAAFAHLRERRAYDDEKLAALMQQLRIGLVMSEREAA